MAQGQGLPPEPPSTSNPIVAADTTAVGTDIMVIDPSTLGTTGALNIGSGVTAVLDFGHHENIVLPGNFTNSGTLYAVSSNPNVTVANFTANNITNNQGALLTTILPQGGLTGFSNLYSALSLNLTAIQNMTNAGTISSAGNLTIIAGDAITNTGSAAVMQAVNNLNMQASQIVNQGTILSQLGNINAITANLTNSGTISAAVGNLNIASLLSQSININNVGGTLSALSGSINIRDALFTAKSDVTLTGGDWISKQLNIFSGEGIVRADVNKITGDVSLNAGAAYTTVHSGDLNLVNLNLTGDPTFYNTGGSVTVGATSVVGDLAIVASQDVIATGNLTSTAGNGQNGHMTLIAGANFTSPTTVNTQVGPDSSTTVVINGGSATGGSVQVSGNIDTNGGNLIVASYGGTGAGSTYTPGTIKISGTTVTDRGSITMVAGATTGTGIQADTITSSGTGGTGNAGAITLITAAPVIGGAGTLSITDGVLTGSLTTTGLTATGAAINVGNILAAGAGGGNATAGGNGGAVTMQAGTSISTGSIRTFGGGGGAGFSSAGGKGGNGGAINVVAAGAFTSTGDLNTSGGGGGAGNVSGSAAGGAGGNAASITVTADSITIGGPILAAGGGAGGTGCCGGGGTGGAGGGGSFGGGGGGGSSIFGIGGGGGGGGFTGGGGGGGGANSFGGGIGGGGGYSGGGGGGGGAGQFSPGPIINYAGAGGGGGGIGIGGGGGAGGSNPCCAGAGVGGAGGTDGTGTNLGSSVGGISNGGGGSGGNGLVVNGGGGNGGMGSGAGSGTGLGGDNPVYNPAGNGGGFGVGGTAAGDSSGATGGGAVGTSGNGGAVTLSAVTAVTISGDIASLATSTGSSGFTGHSYSGDSISTIGATAGNISVSCSSPGAPSVYFADQNLASGASTYTASTGGISTSGAFRTSGSGTITINGSTLGGVSVAAATVNSTYGGSSLTIVEYNGATPINVIVNAGDLVTPAEYIAMVQVSQGGAAAQTLTLSRSNGLTTPGIGYASGGSFAVAASNIPGTFTNLNLPATVTLNSTAAVLPYSGSATVNGTISGTSTTLNVGGSLNVSSTGVVNVQNLGTVGSTITVDGQLQLNHSTTANVIASGMISGSGTITAVNAGALLNLTSLNSRINGVNAGSRLKIQTAKLAFFADGIVVRLENNQALELYTSQASNLATIEILNNGTITLMGSINSSGVIPNNVNINTGGGSSTLVNGAGAGTIYATNLTLNTGTGDMGANGPVVINAPNLTVTSTGTVSLTNTYAGMIALNASSSGAGGFTLNASDPGSGIAGTGSLNSSNVSLSAGTQGIVFPGATALNAQTLQVATTGIATLQSSYAGKVVLKTSSAGSIFSLTVTSNPLSAIALAGDITANSVQLYASDNISQNLFNTSFGVIANELTFSAGGLVNIYNNGSGILEIKNSSGGAVEINALGANAGIKTASGQSITATSFESQTGAGGIDITTNAPTLGTVLSNGGAVKIVDTHNADIIVESLDANGPVEIYATDPNSGLLFNNAFSSVGSATSVKLSSGSGGIHFTSGARITNAPTLEVHTTGTAELLILAVASVPSTTTINNSDAADFRLSSPFLGSSITIAGQLDAPILNLSTTTITRTVNGFINANELTVTASGVVNLVDTYAGTINLHTSSASSFTLDANSPLSGIAASGNLSAPTIDLNAGLNGISMAGGSSKTTANDVTLTSTGSVNVTSTSASLINLQASSSGTANTDSFTFTADNASINVTGGITGYQINLNATGGGATITASSTISGQLVTIITDGSITDGLVDFISTSDVTLRSAAGNIILANGHSFANSIDLMASTGLITSTDTLTGLSTNLLLLRTNTGGSITVGLTNAPSIQTLTSGVVSITDSYNGVISVIGSSAGSFTLNATDTNSGITGVGVPAISSATVDLTAGTAGIDLSTTGINASSVKLNSTGAVNVLNRLNGMVSLDSSSGSSFTLVANQAASGLTLTGPLDAATASLTAGTAGITGTVANTVNATTLSFSSTGAVDLYSSQTGMTSISASNGSSVRFETVGGIMLNGDINSFVSPASTLILLALDTTNGNIETTGAGRLWGTDMRLTANGTTGIGTSAAPVATSFSTLTVYAPNGSVYINNSFLPSSTIAPIGLGGQSLAGGTLSISQTTGSLIVSGPLYAGTFAPGFTPNPLTPISPSNVQLGGDILLTSVGDLTISAGTQLTSRGGSIILSAVNTTGGDNTAWNAWGGDIVVVGSTSVSLTSPTPSTMQAVGTTTNTGGGVGIASGMTVGQVQTELADLFANRVYPFTLDIDPNPGTVTGNTFNLSGGGSLKIAGNANNIVGNTFALGGGVMFINSASIDPFTFTSNGVQVAPPPMPPTPDSSSSSSTNLVVPAAYNVPALYNTINAASIASFGTTVIPTDRTRVLDEAYDAVQQTNMNLPLQGAITQDQRSEPAGHVIFLNNVFDAETLAMFAQNGIVSGPGSGGNYLNLTQGMILVSSESDSIIQTREGKVFIPGGSIVLVYETGADSVIYDFVDTHRPVTVEANKHMLRMHPGEQIILTRNSASPDYALLPGKPVGYRNLQKHDLGDGITAYMGDFSILSAMNNYSPCVNLRVSKDHAQKRAFEKMLKTAAAVHVATQGRGKYSNK